MRPSFAGVVRCSGVAERTERDVQALREFARVRCVDLVAIAGVHTDEDMDEFVDDVQLSEVRGVVVPRAAALVGWTTLVRLNADLWTADPMALFPRLPASWPVMLRSSYLLKCGGR